MSGPLRIDRDRMRAVCQKTEAGRLSYHLGVMAKVASLSALLFAAFACVATGQGNSTWTEPFAPFRVAGNIYFVGTRGVSSFLLTTSDGHILIDTGLAQAVPQVRANVEKLGFTLRDIRIILSSHAHFDHVEGHAEMQRLTGATVMAVGEDAAALAAGQDISALGGPGWKPVKVGRILRDGDTVTLGGVTLTAHLTAGHTKGCTTWTTTVADGGKSLRVVFVGGVSVNQGVQLLDNPRHPSIVADYDRTFKVLKELQADIFLAQHPNMFDMEQKVARNAGGRNPFVDPEGYQAFVAEAEQSYMAQLKRERAGRAQR
jgi:metallo-beta-lactamase class B